LVQKSVRSFLSFKQEEIYEDDANLKVDPYLLAEADSIALSIETKMLSFDLALSLEEAKWLSEELSKAVKRFRR